VVRKYDLGNLRLWQDDLAEVVRLARQLTDVDIYLEADNNELDDVADLPGLGPRVRYFTMVASQPGLVGVKGRRPPGEILKLEFSRSGCVITATEPDLETSGVIEAIRAFLAGRRRMPAWAYPLFRDTYLLSSSRSRPPAETPGSLVLLLLLLAGAAAVEVLAVLSIAWRHDHGHSAPPFGWPSSLAIAVAMAVVIVGLAAGAVMSTTVIFSATRGQAPTWWMRNRAQIVIGVITAAVFFVLGLLIQ
jgi:hypothetical protein